MENINLLRKIAWSFHHSTGLEWDDLFQEAYLAYRYALEHYDPNKDIKMSAFIWIHVSNQLRTYYQKEREFVNPLEKAYSRSRVLQSNLSTWIPEDPLIPEDSFFESLTEDAREIVKLVLSSTRKFIKLNNKEACKRIKETMLNRGWEPERIEYGLNCLKLACSNS